MYVCTYPRNFIFLIYFTGDNLVLSMLTPFSHALVYIDECASNTCVNDGVCADGFDIFTCTRAVGFMGATCDVAKIILFQFTN